MRSPVEKRIASGLRTLSQQTRRGVYRHAPVYQGSVEAQRTPFRTLVGCLVSTRTRDEQTARVCARLFQAAPTPAALARLSLPRLERLLYGAGFYRQKARHLKKLAEQLIAQGGVPTSREGLLRLAGIGPKCANIVLASCFGLPVIAVDTHVHRLSNRLGWVSTKSPEATEKALVESVPPRWRRRLNVLLVAHGQLVCKPLGPLCGDCCVAALCSRRGVATGRGPSQGPG